MEISWFDVFAGEINGTQHHSASHEAISRNALVLSCKELNDGNNWTKVRLMSSVANGILHSF